MRLTLTHERMTLKLYWLLAAVSGALVAEIFKDIGVFIMTESSFFGLLFFAICIDLITGIIKHWTKSEFSFKEMTLGFLKKVVICYSGIALFMILQSIEGVDGTLVGDYFLLLGRVMVILYPAGSAFENFYFITAGKFPPLGFMKKMKNFNEDLDLDHFKK